MQSRLDTLPECFMGCHYFGENTFFQSASYCIMVQDWTRSAEICFQAHHQRHCFSGQAEKLECIQTKNSCSRCGSGVSAYHFHPTRDANNQKESWKLDVSIGFVEGLRGFFPRRDFKPLWTNAALESSNDTIRMNLARVLVTKVLNEGKRLALISKIAEPNGKLLRSVVRGLIQSQGVLTPSLYKYLKVSLSSSHIESWKKFKRGNKKKCGPSSPNLMASFYGQPFENSFKVKAF